MFRTKQKGCGRLLSTGAAELPEAHYNLVASRHSGGARVPNRLVLLPGQWLADGAEVEVDFNGPFLFHPEVEQLAVLGIRSGELLSGSVELVTPGVPPRA